jgi:hypothetical protein
LGAELIAPATDLGLELLGLVFERLDAFAMSFGVRPLRPVEDEPGDLRARLDQLVQRGSILIIEAAAERVETFRSGVERAPLALQD